MASTAQSQKISWANILYRRVDKDLRLGRGEEIKKEQSAIAIRKVLGKRDTRHSQGEKGRGASKNSTQALKEGNGTKGRVPYPTGVWEENSPRY